MGYIFNFSTRKFDYFVTVPTTPSNTVFFDTEDPNDVATVFDPNTPEAADTLYVSQDVDTAGATWVWNSGTSTYETETITVPASTPFFLAGTAIDAGSNKTAIIQRSGEIRIVNSTLARSRVLSGSRQVINASFAADLNYTVSGGADYVVGTSDAKNLSLQTNYVERIGVASTGAIRFNSAYTFPTADGTVGQALKTNGAGVLSFGDVSVSVPQTNKIYVDSVNGINSTGRGNINNPYLTPEYALADITNTGTVTATTTNASATLTAVSSTANIVVGQFITGAGIPYNSVVVSKTVNTIVLSQVCTASATITATWITPYQIFCIGSFTLTSSIARTGMWFDFETYSSTLIVGNLTAFLYATGSLIPEFIKLGNTNLNHVNSALLRCTTGVMAEVNLTPNNVFSIGTDYVIGSSSTVLSCTTLNVGKGYINARFGYVAYIGSDSGNIIFNCECYGLLGGIRKGGTSYFKSYGNVTSPASVLALNLSGASSNNDIYGTITGSTSISGSSGSTTIHSQLIGTTHTFGSGNLEKTTVVGRVSGNVINLDNLVLLGHVSGNITNQGGVISNCTIIGGCTGTVTATSGMILWSANQGSVNLNYAVAVVIGAGSMTITGMLNATTIGWTGVGRLINNGDIYISPAGINNTNANLHITTGTFINNGNLIDKSAGSSSFFNSLFTKASGYFQNNGYIYSSNGLFGNYQVNSSPAKDVVIGFCKSNSNAYSGTTKSNGTIKRLTINAVDLATSVNIFDGTNTVTISTSAGTKPISQIISELITAIQGSILQYQALSSFGSQLLFVGGSEVACTFASLTNCTDSGTYNGGGGFTPTELGGGTELKSTSFLY